MNQESWTIQKLLEWTTDYFKKFNIEWPHLEAEILLAHALGVKRIELYTQHEKVVSPDHLAIYKSYLQRRIKHEPIAYITGYQPFMSLDFIVDQSVLIPRPETEKLVETIIDLVRKPETKFILRSFRNPCETTENGRLGFLNQGGNREVYSQVSETLPSLTIADIGTGCGCIAISLAKHLPDVEVIGTDSSPEAIKMAQKNAERHQVPDRCKFVVGNMLEPLKNVGAAFMAARSGRTVDLIVSNPPYIPTADIETLMPDVKDYEPRQALDGGPDGLDYIRQLITDGPKYAKYLIFEFGIGQAESIKELAKDKFKEIKIIKDNAGIERVFVGLTP